MTKNDSLISRIGLKLFKYSIKVNASVSGYFDNQRGSSLIDNDLSCELIVFSKDRAIQLHALLSTYFEMVQHPIHLNVLYTCSDNEHQTAYNELIRIFNSKNVSFIKEKSFRDDFINLVKNLNSSKVMFMTDDAVIVDSFDMNNVLKVNPLVGVFQLHRGHDAKYNMHSGVDEKQPPFRVSAELDKDLIYWEFNKDMFSVTYNYPLSLDGTLLNRREMLRLFRRIKYKAPNSLEAMMQVYNPVMLNRKGLCFTKSKYVNIPCNLVNAEVINISTGHFTVENLLEKWNAGFRIRYEAFYHKNYDEVLQAKFDFVSRT